MVSVNNGNRIYKVYKAQVVPQPSNKDQTAILSLLKPLRPLNSQLPPNVLITKVLERNEPRGTSGEFNEAIGKEIDGSLDKKAFKVVIHKEVGKDANIFGGTFVLPITKKGTTKKILKGGYVVQGHLDKDKRTTRSYFHDGKPANYSITNINRKILRFFCFRGHDVSIYVRSKKDLKKGVGAGKARVPTR